MTYGIEKKKKKKDYCRVVVGWGYSIDVDNGLRPDLRLEPKTKALQIAVSG